MDTGTGVSPGQFTVSIGIRDLPEFVCLIADLQRLQADMEAGGMYPSDAAEALATIIEPWGDDQIGS